MMPSFFLHILILSCAVHYTWGLECYSAPPISGKIEDPDPDFTGAVTENCTSPEICFIRYTDNGGTSQSYLTMCMDKPQNMVCKDLLGDYAGKTPPRAVGGAYCETDKCNIPAFLKDYCKGSSGAPGPGPGPGPAPGNTTKDPNTTTTAHHTHAPSYFTMFMAYAVTLTIAGITHSKIHS